MEDTPEKTQIVNALTKFEDSPVFSYINSLSPIKPVKSAHLTQTFNSLTFASPPSVFTSPHLNNSHKESRFLRRHNYPDLPKPDFSSENGKKVGTNEVVVDATLSSYDKSAELHGNFNLVGSIRRTSFEQSMESLRTLKYDHGRVDAVTESASELGGSSSSEPNIQGTSETVPLEGEAGIEKICHNEQHNEETGCDWESLISNAAELMLFNSPCDPDASKGLTGRHLEAGTAFHTSLLSGFPQENVSNATKLQLVNVVGFSIQDESECRSSQLDETVELDGINLTQGNDILDCSMASNSDANPDNQSLHRGVLRRCLDFEAIAARCKKLDGDSSNSSSSFSSQSDERINPDSKNLLPAKRSNESWRILPGIGLHLNALAINSKESNTTKHEILPSGVAVQLRLSNSITTFQEPVGEPLTSALIERDISQSENCSQLTEDASMLPVNSPRKKRRRTELAGENDACKRCNCKKSKCLKLYCECFAAGVYCIEPCSCQECFNKPIHEDTVLATRKQIESRNPLAFAPKVIRSLETINETRDDLSMNKTPASARHKRGCNCKKSSCLKKYCECYQGGVGCSINCRCEGCMNAFGRKDGSAVVTEAEVEEETEKSEKIDLHNNLSASKFQSDEQQQNPSALPITPLQINRPQFSSGKPPSSVIVNGSSSQCSTTTNSTRYGKPNIVRSRSKLCRTIEEDDEIPEILLQDKCSPSSGIQTSSPNKKRVIPPYCESEPLSSLSPSLRSGRKLILRSIPSFPSLTPQ